MIDMHTHILPGVDDGAGNWDESIKMLVQAYKSGTREIVLTPHGNWGDYENADHQNLIMRYNLLNQVLQKSKMELKLYMGMEVLCTDDLQQKLEEKKLLTINNTKYILVEFPFQENIEYSIKMLDIIEKNGMIPVIAHAERYDCVQENPDIVYYWNRKGYGIQVNAGSLFGVFGKKEMETARLLLDHNLVHLIATDCHDTEERTSDLYQAYQFIEKQYSDGYAELLMKINPKRILNNQKILIVNPRLPY